jgi:hypothetical protein
MQTSNPYRPRALIGPQGEYLPQSWRNLAYQGDVVGGANLIYVGFAIPGSDVNAPVWQIFKIGYTGGIPTSITWPIGADGGPSSDFAFIWANRAALTYQ